jgi:ribosomal protein S18 acetylase RimI-like enzyme
MAPCINFVKMTFACRRATTADEVRQYHVGWGANENWNTSLGDADSLFAQDNHGFFLGELTESGTTTVIATLQVAKYDRDYVHIAAYQVLPQYRGKGYGKTLWDYGMEYAYNDGRTVGLDGALAQQENYKKVGFVQAFYAYRYGTHSDNIKKTSDTIQYCTGLEMKKATELPFEQVLSYDTKYVGAPRSGFLRNLIERPDARTGVVLDQGEIVGFACLRESQEGYRFGPLYAETPLIARDLFVSLSRQVDGNVFIETPVVTRELPEIHTLFEMKECGENARMYVQGKNSINFGALPIDNIYSIVWELG